MEMSPNVAPKEYLMANLDCPHQLGVNACTCGMGHTGMHQATRQLTDSVCIEVLWADEWLPLSVEAELQIGGNAAEVGLA